MKSPVYLDYAATAPVDPRVAEVMHANLVSGGVFANPSALTHAAGRQANAVVETAREQVAQLINADAREIVWTSGATESDNLAIIGAARFRRARGDHIVTLSTEHKAVLESCRQLEREGFVVSYLDPDSDGIIDPALIAAALRPETLLVSIMHANNETGVLQDIAAIGRLCRERDVLFHVDAAQSAGKELLDVKAQQIDLLSLNAHKMCGPKGVGALYLDAERIPRVAPLLYGGEQQRGIRPGTLPGHQVAGMGAACAIALKEMASERERVGELRDQLWTSMADNPAVLLNGHPQQRLAGMLNVSVAGVEGESLLFALRDLTVSSGSACNSTSGEPSYVLRSLGRSDELAQSSIRFSLGRFSTVAEVDFAAQSFAAAVHHLQAMLPTAAEG